MFYIYCFLDSSTNCIKQLKSQLDEISVLRARYAQWNKKGKILTSNFFCYIFCLFINNVERMGLLKLQKQTKLRAK